MTETEKKALALVNEVSDGFHDVTSLYAIHTAKALRSALCRAIEQHEAFRQEVSDAVLSFWKYTDGVPGHFERFIIAKPDPLVEVLQEISGEGGYDNFDHYAYRLRSALEARGLEVRKIGEGG